MATIDNYKEVQEAEAPLKEFDGNLRFNSKQKKVYNNLEEDLDAPKIDHPAHYQSYNPEVKIECIEAMRAAFGDEAVAIWCKLNAFKYNWRADSKGGNVDIAKMVWYGNKYLELMHEKK